MKYLLTKLKKSGPGIIMFLLILQSVNAFAQRHRPSAALKMQEESLRVFADSMILAGSAPDRFRADSNFVRGLVRSLNTPYSFYYPFDSIKTVSKLMAPDSSFRIFTWQLQKDEYFYLQKGAIQVNTPDGSLGLFPLFDYSMYTQKPEDSVRSPKNWIGAIYYRIILKEHAGKKYYTLFGFDDFSVSSNKKWIEVLTFNSRGEPVFGGPYFSYKEDTAARPVQYRYSMEYKKEATTLLKYDPELDMIVFDHLISETDQPERKSTYIPDGSYEGFRWKNGQWVHVDKVFDFQLQDGQFPVEEQLRDADGNIDEERLQRSSEKNYERSQQSD